MLLVLHPPLANPEAKPHQPLKTIGILFDLDGTLVDSLTGIAASLNRALAAEGLPTHNLDAVRGFIGNGARMLVTRGAAPLDDPSLIDRLEIAFKSDYDLTWPEGTHPYPGIIESLTELHQAGHSLAVLSNKPDPFTVAIVARLFPDIPFAAVIGQKPGIPHKPHPAGAFEASRNMNRATTECVLIGDSTMDIETARAANMRAIAVPWGYHDRHALEALNPDAWIESPHALAKTIALLSE
jgi:phosphoglycolate phosphatase